MNAIQQLRAAEAVAEAQAERVTADERRLEEEVDRVYHELLLDPEEVKEATECFAVFPAWDDALDAVLRELACGIAQPQTDAQRALKSLVQSAVRASARAAVEDRE